MLPRKWRPKNFSEVIGQQHVLQALINALDQKQLHHAYLFSGTHGVGKTTLARILAKCVNCETGISSTPCEQCQNCRDIAAGRFVDFLEIDAASRTGVDDMRELLQNAQYSCHQGRYKIYLIDETHMLSNQSFNALLKTLEEPPSHVIFIFATTESQKIPVTVLSRCLQFNLKKLTVAQIQAQLQHILEQEKISFVEEALVPIAEAARGSLRDGLSLLEQAVAYCNNNLTLEQVRTLLGTIDTNQVLALLQGITENQGSILLTISEQLARCGTDFKQALQEICNNMQRIAVLQVISNPPPASKDQQ